MSIGSLKSLLLLWKNLAINRRYATLVDLEDIETFEKRACNEGLSFLTTTLPTLGKALDSFHATGAWTPPDHFKTDWDGIPLFLGKAIRFALDGNSRAVDCVRQLSYIFYKLEVDYSDEVVADFLSKFEENDRTLNDAMDMDNAFTLSILRRMNLTIRRILCNSNPLDIRPCHGSGATACRTPNWDKWHLLRYFPKLDAVYSYPEYFFYSPSHLVDELQMLKESNESVPRARVCLVPKDSRGPRIISCEPAELMYIQQGIMRRLYEVLENHPFTRGQLNFTDQKINRDMAKTSSISGKFATLDLSEASDRVSLRLIRHVFPPNWVEALEACRSEETILPSGKVIKLNKFAPMGSSCCFPVEALVFWACAEAVRHIKHPRNKDDIYVYGDDIIVSSVLADDIVMGLESIGLIVNKSKSYLKGPFRESCGGDYYLGSDVTPVRVRKFFSLSGTGLATSADFCNELLQKFGEADAKPLISIIEDQLGYVFPRSELPIPGTLRLHPSASNDVFYRRKWNFSLQRWEHRVLSLTSKALAKQPPNWGELLRKELQRDNVGGAAGKYQHWTKVIDAALEPGQYTDPHSVRNVWTWIWLG